MKKLVHLSLLCAVIFHALQAMEATEDTIQFEAASVTYTILSEESLLKRSLTSCIKILIASPEHAKSLLTFIDQAPEHEVSCFIRETLINEYLVPLCRAYNDEFTGHQLNYYAQPEPTEYRTETDCLHEGAVIAELTPDNGIIIVSVHSQQEVAPPPTLLFPREDGVYRIINLDYWSLDDLRDPDSTDKKPLHTTSIPIGLALNRAHNFSQNVEIYTQPYTTRLFIFSWNDAYCQLWNLTNQGFDLELSLPLFRPDFVRFSPDGEKICLRGSYRRRRFFCFNDIDTLKQHAVNTILNNEELSKLCVKGEALSDDDTSWIEDPICCFCHSVSSWDATSDTVVYSSVNSRKIEIRNAQDMYHLNEIFNPEPDIHPSRISGYELLSGGDYLLITERCVKGNKNIVIPEKLWLFDLVHKQKELLATSDITQSIRPPKLLYRNSPVKKSVDEQFALLCWEHKNPLLYDLQQKKMVEITLASQEDLLQDEPRYSRSAHISRDNDLLIFLINRRVHIISLKTFLRNKSMEELVHVLRQKD